MYHFHSAANLLRCAFYDENARYNRRGGSQRWRECHRRRWTSHAGRPDCKENSRNKVRKLADGKVIGWGFPVPPPTLLPSWKSSRAIYPTIRAMLRAAVETVKEWRTDRALRNLEAMLIAANN